MQKSKEYLDNSVRCYQNLLEHVHTFKESIDNGVLTADNYNHHSSKLIDLQKMAEVADKDLMEHLGNQTDTLLADSVMFKKRREMMQEVLEINNYLLPRLASLMDITKDELIKLKGSMRNIGGYHSGITPPRGKVIRNKA